MDYVAAYHLFRTLYGDDFDFVTIFHDTGGGFPGVLNSYASHVFGDVQGIGLEPRDERPVWRSRRLQGFTLSGQVACHCGRLQPMSC